MATRKRLSGRFLNIFTTTDTNAGATKDKTVGLKALGCVKNTSVNLNAKIEEVSDKDTAVAGEQEFTGYEWDLSSDGLIATMEQAEALMDALKKGTKLFCIFGQIEQAPGAEGDKDVEQVTGKKWTLKKGSKGEAGWAVVSSFSINAPNDSQATWNISLKGSGELETITIASN